MKKKLFFIFIVLVLSLSVVGCGTTSDSVEGSIKCWVVNNSFTTVDFPVYNQETNYWETITIYGLELRLTDGSFYCYRME